MNDYEKNELKVYLQDYCDSVLERTNKPNFYICPFCGSGTGKHKTAAFNIFPDADGKKRKYKCLACGASGDLYKLIMWNENLTFSQALERAQQLYGLSDSCEAFARMATFPTPKKRIMLEPEMPSEEWQNAIMPIVKRAQAAIFEDVGKPALDYLNKRGIYNETIRNHGIGFIPMIEAWGRDKGVSFAIESPFPDDGRKLGIPYGITFPYMMDGHLLKLETRRLPAQEETAGKIGQVRGGKTALFNADDAACEDKRRDILFTEGVIDALSINQSVGRWCNDEIKAVTFGSATTKGDADAFYKWYVMPYRVIVGFDNDDAGRQNGLILAEEINRARADAGRNGARLAFPPEQYKDWNEFLVECPDKIFGYISNLFYQRN